MDSTLEVPRGLAGVVVTETGLGDVRGREGFYHYRQYSAVELAATRGFEDVWHLMFRGTLPVDAAERAAFTAEIAPLRRLPQEVRDALPDLARATRLSGPSPDCARHCRCSAPRPASARSTTSTPAAGPPTRWPPVPPYRPC